MNIRNKLLESFPAFTHRNFKLFWFGQVVSLMGTWMQNTALNWLVYSMTNDRFLLGLMNAVQFTPFIILSLYAGIVVEKYPKRKIIILTQSLQLVFAFILFILVYIERINYPIVLLILFGIGCVQTFDNPARQSFVVEMVEGRDHLLNAIALNSAAFNAARLVGPAISGMVMAALGAKWCFFLNAASFIAVLIGLLMMVMDDAPVRKTQRNNRKDIVEGIKFILNTPKLLYTFISVSIICTFGINFNILIPPFARDVLGLKEGGYGILLSSLGFGALVAALTVAARGKRERNFYYQITGSLGLAISLVLAGLANTYLLAVISLAICGFFMIMYNTTSNSMLQFNSPDHMRGRIMSVYSLIFGGLIPFGSLYAGAIAKRFGPQYTFIISGGICFIGFLFLFARRKELK